MIYIDRKRFLMEKMMNYTLSTKEFSFYVRINIFFRRGGSVIYFSLLYSKIYLTHLLFYIILNARSF